MVEISCPECSTAFVPKIAFQKFCCTKCSGKNWRRENRKHLNAYMLAWKSENPLAMQEYNEKRRRGPKELPCSHCGKTFLRKSRAQFCSVECQRKGYWTKTENKQRRRLVHNAWVRQNKPVVTALHKRYALAEKQRTPWSSLLRASKGRAKKFGISHNLDSAWAEARWTGHCELTGIEFAKPAARTGRSSRSFFPSIDRIKPELGYVKENCRIVLWAVNSLRGDGDDATMFFIANTLMQNTPQNPAAFLALPG